MKTLVGLLVVSLAILMVACGPSESRKIDSTLATPDYGLVLPGDPGWPSFEDYRISLLYGGVTRVDRYDAYYDHFAAVYVAGVCLAGSNLSPQRFQLFVNESFPHIERWAENVIKKMIRLADSNKDCIRPYRYPKSGAEAVLAIGLYKAVVFDKVPAEYKDAWEKRVVTDALEWFNLKTRAEKPFLPWLCSNPESDCEA